MPMSMPPLSAVMPNVLLSREAASSESRTRVPVRVATPLLTVMSFSVLPSRSKSFAPLTALLPFAVTSPVRFELLPGSMTKFCRPTVVLPALSVKPLPWCSMEPWTYGVTSPFL